MYLSHDNLLGRGCRPSLKPYPRLEVGGSNKMQTMEYASIRRWTENGCPGADLDTLRRYTIEGQGAQGGGKDRSGHEDTYYTGFFIRLLKGMGPELVPEYNEKVEGAGKYVEKRVENARRMSDLLAIAITLDAYRDVADITEYKKEVMDHLKGLEVGGGYTVAPGTEIPTIFDTHCAIQVKAILSDRFRLSDKQKDNLHDFINSRVAPDGGMSNRPGKDKSGIVPTCAGLIILKTAARLDDDVKNLALKRLFGFFDTESGGFRSSDRTQFPDLLSTRMAISTLSYLETLTQLNHEGLERIVRFVSMCRKGGCYSSVPVDQAVDLEYTYYGVVTQSLLRDVLGHC